MRNFLEVYADPKAIRALLESIHPISFGQVNGRLWTTTGELDKFTSDGTKGCGQRVTKGVFDFVEVKTWRLEDEDDAGHLAAQMGKPQGCFGAALAMWKFVSAIPPELALLAIVVHKSPRADAVRAAVGLPQLSGSELITQIKNAIEFGKPHPSWGYTIRNLKPAPEPPKGPIVAGELSGLLQVCFAEEAKAKGQYDKAVAVLESAKAALDEAFENTKAIVRATEIAERLAK
jgi:hypothetical protein